MSDTETTHDAEETEVTSESSAEESRILSIEAINAKLDEVMRKLSGGARSPARGSARDDAADVGEQVKSEVRKLRAAEDARKRSDARDGRLADLEDKVKKLTEKAPAEYRKITQRLWGDPE